MQLSIFVTVFCMYFLPCSRHAIAEPSGRAAQKVFVGYVTGMPEQINYRLYTHLCHAFVVAEKDGTLLPRAKVPSHQLAQNAHAAGVKVLISLGGWVGLSCRLIKNLKPRLLDRDIVIVVDHIKADNRVTALHERLGGMEADEPGIACHQDLHLKPSIALAFVKHAFDIEEHRTVLAECTNARGTHFGKLAMSDGHDNGVI